jgi:hypothetical protein
MDEAASIVGLVFKNCKFFKPFLCEKKNYKFWVDCNLHGESFEAYDTTDGRSLRIRATKLVSLGTLSLEMVDFVEIIKYSVCVWLSTRGCPSLHRFFDIITEKWVYGILFGPLALVNTTVGVTFGLYLVII